MKPITSIILLTCLLISACEQKSPASGRKDSVQTIKQQRSLEMTEDSFQSVDIDLPPFQGDITDPQFSMDSLRMRVQHPGLDIEGRVIVEVLVDTNGTVRKMKVIESAHDLLNESALDAIRPTRFTPAYHNDTHQPIAVWVSIPIDFTMR